MPCSTSFSTWPLTFYNWLQFPLWPGILEVTSNLVKTPPCPYLSIIKSSLFPMPKKKCPPAPFGEGNGNTLQYSCLENAMDRGAWRATVHGVRKSRTQLKWLSTASLMLYAVYANCSIILNTIMLADPFVFQNPQQEVEAKITVGFPICHPVFSILLSLVRCLSSLHISSGKAHPFSLLPLPVS